ncbi:helix-turn-helix transcriptional regulator [Motilimonas sp. 1_MG-2023]|uniref:helix-turn-helix domain-containing protein n=1 Tax=Motilimonas sp. 1_MG-2023 TaxID=3062672 RepID=UPI0026E44ED6|nr:helix-turn-helix transcriptional regulator [Motilimonas sp. 1_MG-2023]MDO6526661.1 helix-turn-helix transcriptional regulator [Motilimonas sp. 1_MG-2023]
MSHHQHPIVTAQMYQQLLANNDIYFVAFDQAEQILASNYPVSSLQLNCLDDLVFLIGHTNIEGLRAYILNPTSALSFTVANLVFEVIRLSDPQEPAVFALQIQSRDALADEPKLSVIEQDYKIINELASSLSMLTSAPQSQMPESLQQEVRNKHLPEVEKRLQQLQDPMLRMCLEIVKSSMTSLINDAPSMNAQLLQVLTPSELQVAEFIRGGMSSKDIASTLNVARKTVENHRNSLRNKLGITNRGVNLKNYLLGLQQK